MRDALPEPLAQRVRAIPPLRWLLQTKDGSIVVGQRPNVPLLIALAFTMAAIFLPAARPPATLAWTMWSGLELGSGVNPFRRLLGLFVLLSVGLGVWLRR